MMKKALVVLALAMAVTGAAWAKDSVQAAVSNVTPSAQLLSILVGGSPYTQGEYTAGELSLTFTYTGTSFPSSGTFGSFNLALQTVSGNGPATVYPVTVNLNQPGNQSVTLTPGTSSFSATGTGAVVGTPTGVTISFSCDSSCQSNNSANSSVISGLLQINSASPSALNSSVQVHVHIQLVYPTTSCVTFSSSVWDQDHTADSPLTNTLVNYNQKNNVVLTTNPYGQWSYDVLLTNSGDGCATLASKDILIVLDPRFETNPNNNPGNAVFSYLGGTDVSTTAYTSKTPQGQSVCLSTGDLANGSGFLATVHMGIIKQVKSSWPTTAPFAFNAYELPAGSCPTTSSTGNLGNASSSVSYTLK